jgi:hypothetical protein
MSDEVYIVSAYTPDVEREELLRKLVSQLHSAKKDILLITHSVTPNDIVKKCNYYIYDEENKILYDDRYKHLAWNTCLPGAIIHSKDVRRTYTTLLPVYKLVLFGFGFAKMAGYKYAHYLEYDSEVENFKFFENNVNILKNHSCVSYTNIHGHPIGFYFAFNLNEYSYEDLKYDENKFLDKLTEYYPNLYLVEELTRLFFMDTKNAYYKNPDEIKKEGLIGAKYCSRNSKNSVLSWAIPIVENDLLFLFLNDQDRKDSIIEYIINDSYKRVTLHINEWHYFPLCIWKDAKFLKIFIDGESHLEYDLTKPEVRTRLMQNNFIERN